MASIPLELPTESSIGVGMTESAVRLINGYSELLGTLHKETNSVGAGKALYATYAAPGITRWDVGVDGQGTPYTGATQGMVPLSATQLVAVIGGSVVQFGTGGYGTAIGSVGDTNPVIMAKNNATTPEVAILTQSGAYSLLSGGSLTQPDLAGQGIPTPNSVTYLNGYYLFGIEDGRIFQSNFEDGSTISALSFAYANAFPDKLLRTFCHFGMLYAFCSSHLEVWQDAGTTPFAFSPVYQNIELGCMSAYAIVSTAKGLFWVDHEGRVQFGRDMNAQRVSTHTVERAISSLSHPEQQAMQGCLVSFFGHECYALSSDHWTWIYDLQMQRWTERKSYGQDNWIVSMSCLFNGAYVLGSNSAGKLYTLDETNYTEDGQPLLFEAWCKNVHNFPNGMIIDQLSMDIISGVGNPNDPNPLMSVDYSDDGGHTFKGERLIDLGAAGQFSGKVSLNQWGRVSHKGRIFRIRGASATLRGVTQAVLKVRKANA